MGIRLAGYHFTNAESFGPYKRQLSPPRTRQNLVEWDISPIFHIFPSSRILKLDVREEARCADAIMSGGKRGWSLGSGSAAKKAGNAAAATGSGISDGALAAVSRRAIAEQKQLEMRLAHREREHAAKLSESDQINVRVRRSLDQARTAYADLQARSEERINSLQDAMEHMKQELHLQLAQNEAAARRRDEALADARLEDQGDD